MPFQSYGVCRNPDHTEGIQAIEKLECFRALGNRPHVLSNAFRTLQNTLQNKYLTVTARQLLKMDKDNQREMFKNAVTNSFISQPENVFES